jgi:hypothetical protein
MENPIGVEIAAPSPQWSEVGSHANFSPAARLFSAHMLRLCDEDTRLCAVFKDAGRYVAAMSAAYLHGTGGLTVPLLKQICAASGFLSPGRARAIVDFLVYLDYLRPTSGAHYVPTERFLSAWCGHLQAALEAAALIEPALAPLPARLDDPGAFEAFLAIQAARLYALTRGPDPFAAMRRAFLHPHAGSQVLWLLTLSLAAEVPPEDGMARLSLSEISSRFDVTHLHVRRLLKRAQEEGLIVYHGRGLVSFTPEGARTIRLFHAFQFSELIASGRALLAQAPVRVEAHRAG